VHTLGARDGRKTALPRNGRPKPRRPRRLAIIEFIQQLRAYLVQEFARGRDIDQIFGDLEESYRRVEKALRKS